MKEIALIYKSQKTQVKTPADLLIICNFLLQLPDHYSPLDVFKENISTAVKCVYELADAYTEQLNQKVEETTNKDAISVLLTKKKEVTKIKIKLTYMLKALDYQKTTENALKFIYNIRLGFEGLGLLNGFGVANKFGDRIEYYDPERKSILGG